VVLEEPLEGRELPRPETLEKLPFAGVGLGA